MQSILSFYRDVYTQELSHSKTLHIHSSGIVKLFYPSKREDILTDEMPFIPVSEKHGEEIMKTLELRSGEVQLKYFAMARISKFISLNKHETKRVYPLFSFDAEIVLRKGEYYLEINKESRTIMKNNFPSKITGHGKFPALTRNHTLDFHFATQLGEIIEKATPKADFDDLLLYPELWSIRKINADLRKDFQVSEKYIPTGILALVEKDFNSFNSLSELNEILEKETFSAPLNVLFNDEINSSEDKPGIICEELNKSQLNAIDNSNNSLISVISGPPGTGKSFTIANIVTEKISTGNSVLITSKNKEALTVVEEKIEKQLGLKELCVNPGQDKKLQWMVKHLDYILGHDYEQKKYKFHQIEDKFIKFQKVYDGFLKQEKDIIKTFEKEKNLYEDILSNPFSGPTTSEFKKRIFKSRSKATIPLWETLENYYKRIRIIRKSAVEIVQRVTTYRLEEGIRNHRRKLRDYQAFIRARDLERKKQLAEKIDYEAVLSAFPVWLARANDVAKMFPQKKEMFDLLIIDEASQCDIPSLIPLMYRAKKVVVVGDNKQLSHISFISKDFENACRTKVQPEKKHLCKHRDYSILDLVEDNIDPLFKVRLNEHFRSQFPIISFSNEAFYDGDLDILTKRPISVAEQVQFIKTEGKRTRGRVEEEATAILEKIREIIEDESGLPPRLKTSIGILSPFRKQVDFIFNQLRDTFTLREIRNHQILVGTAFSFQGNERDLMLLSLGLDDKSLGGSFTFLNRKDVFNVSVTRARNKQIIFYSFDPNKLNPNSTTAHFFRHYTQKLKDDKGRSTRDEFCLEVETILNDAGLETWTNFGISGIEIDLLFKKDERFIGIDLIGFPGEMQDYYSLERYKMIERGNIQLFPLPYVLWLGDKEKCIKAIFGLLENPEEKKKPKAKKKKTTRKKPKEKIVKKSTEPPTHAKDFTLLRVDGKDGLSVNLKLIFNNRTYAELDIKPETEDKTTQVSVLWFEAKANFKYKGLENRLLKEFIEWTKTTKSLKKVFAVLSPTSTKEKKLLEKYGFVVDYASWASPVLDSATDEMTRMVLFLN